MVKETKMRELERSECINSVMTITHILNIDRKKWSALEILQLIDDVVFVCTCKVFSYINKTITSQAFVYDSNFHINK